MKRSMVFALNAALHTLLSAIWLTSLAMVIATDSWNRLTVMPRYLLVVGAGLPIGVAVMIWLYSLARRDEARELS